MVRKNVFLMPVIFLFVFLIGSAILFHAFREKIDIISPNIANLFSLSFLIGLIVLVVCLVLFAREESRIVRDAFIECLLRFSASKAFIDEISNSEIDMKKEGIWKEAEIEYAGQRFVLALEIRLGPSRRGFTANLLVSKDINGDASLTDSICDKVMEIKLSGLVCFRDENHIFLRFPISPKLDYEHIISAMDILVSYD